MQTFDVNILHYTLQDKAEASQTGAYFVANQIKNSNFSSCFLL